MVEKVKVQQLCEDALASFDGFLVELSIGQGNEINVLVDTDEGITLGQLKEVSRHIESGLDREEEDFRLEVSSPGLSRPLTMFRQYQKNIGRTISVKTNAGEQLKGTLLQCDESELELTWKERVPKPVGKGKVTVEKKQKIALSDVLETKIIISI